MAARIGGTREALIYIEVSTTAAQPVPRACSSTRLRKLPTRLDPHHTHPVMTHIGYRTSTRNNKDQPSVNQNEIQRSGFKLIGVQVPLTSVFVPKGAHGTTEAPRGGAHQTTLEVPGETLI